MLTMRHVPGTAVLVALAISASACVIAEPAAGSGADADGGVAVRADASAEPAGDARHSGADAGAPPVDAGSSAGADAGASNPCSGALVCDDFESDAVGAAPGSPWSVSLTNAPQGAIAVDSTRAHSGSHSLKVAVGAASGYRSAMLGYARNLPVSGNDLYGRMMTWLESAPSTSVHWTFIDGYGLVPGQSYHSVYRYGGQLPISDGGTFVGSQLMANYDTPDFYQSPPVGVGSDCWMHSDKKVVPTGRWACVEWRFNGAANKMQFWLDGSELTDLAMYGTGQGCSQQSASFTWTAPTFERIDVGWESYQADDARTLWIDDVAIGTQRIGCPSP